MGRSETADARKTSRRFFFFYSLPVQRYNIDACWEQGAIPPQCKTAHVVMIPKPGKKLLIDNLRPISLTSCVGKLMEHVVLNRLSNYMKDRGLYSLTMIGFRPKLSRQDVLLQIKHKILDARGKGTD